MAKRTLQRFFGSVVWKLVNRGIKFLILAVPATPLAMASEETTYEYDALGRLIEVSKDDGTVVGYDYDPAGNRQSKETTVASPPPPPPPPGNNPPDAVNDSMTVTAIFESAFKDLTANDSDPDGDSLTITVVSQPSNGIVTIITPTVVQFVGTSYGPSFFMYTISDGNGGTDSAVVAVNVLGGGGGFDP